MQCVLWIHWDWLKVSTNDFILIRGINISSSYRPYNFAVWGIVWSCHFWIFKALTWNNWKLFICFLVIQCHLPEVPHMLFASNKTNVGSVVGIKCELGYRLNRRPSRTCSPTYGWHSFAELTAVCKAEYRASLNNSLMCTATGDWFPPSVTCERE